MIASEGIVKAHLRAMELEFAKAMRPLFVLKMLEEKDMIAVQIEAELDKRTNHVLIGNIRPMLNMLEQNGYIAESAMVVNNRLAVQRRYTITENGRELKRRLHREYRYLVRLINSVLREYENNKAKDDEETNDRETFKWISDSDVDMSPDDELMIVEGTEKK